MKVILLEDVKPHGKKGDVINVSDGYANNFLLKNKLAKPATADTMNALNIHNAKIEREKQTEKQKAIELAKKIETTPLTVHIKAGENGKIYGSVTTKEIAEAFAKEGLVIDKKNIVLKDHLKITGIHAASVKLFPGVTVPFKVEVVAEK